VADRRPRRAELLAELNRWKAALAAGRRKGATMQALAAALRRSAIDHAVRDLVANSQTARWKTDACSRFIFDRQSEIGLRRRYSFATLDRLVRAALRKHRLRDSGSAIQKSE